MSTRRSRPELVNRRPDPARPEALLAELRDSEARYHSLFEGSRDAIYVTTREGRFVDVNSSFLNLFGYSRSQLLEMNAQVLYVAPADRMRFQHEVERLGAVRDFEVSLRTNSGRVLDCLLTSTVRHAADGSVVSYQGIIHDITSGKQARLALENSEHFNRTLVASVGEGVIAYDRSLRYRLWNRFMEVLTGVPAAQVIGTHAAEHFPHLLEQGILNLLDRALAGETVKSEDTPYFVPSTGKSGWVSASYSPLRAPDGSVDGVVAIIHDVTDRKRAEQQLEHGAYHDALTGLPNRTLFIQRLTQGMAQSRKQLSHSFAVLFLDLDRFKAINDSLGHMVGDRLLIAIARRLENCVRAGDTIARLGGDEFAILLDHIEDARDAVRVAERALAELGTFNIDGHELITTASIGIAISNADYAEPDHVIRDADTAMYRAKAGGRARYEIFDAHTPTDAQAALQLETDLRRSA
jgi:diguanylate cyclase (GGDEF)-like protein/PAS domain S-box-containing protein